MTPLEQPAFPLGENVRRAVYWLSALTMVVASYLGVREIIDGVDMSFITIIAGVVCGMAGVNTPKRMDHAPALLIEEKD